MYQEPKIVGQRGFAYYSTLSEITKLIVSISTNSTTTLFSMVR